MDNLTHSLVGAVIGRMGLKRLSPRAMPALIIAANLPDIDSFVAPVFGCDPLAAHRGFTHGIGGLVTMPFLAVAIILVWEKLRPGNEGPPKLGGLLLACFLGVLSHPLLDFLNTYGTRLLEPFSHRWFYGDTLFIMDPWIWIILILGLEFSWRAERRGGEWRRPAVWAFGAMLGYIGLNAAISARAVALDPPAGRAGRGAADDRRRRGAVRILEAADDLARRRDRRVGDLRTCEGPQPRGSRPQDRAARTSTIRASPPPRNATVTSAPSCSGRGCRWSSSRIAGPSSPTSASTPRPVRCGTRPS